MNSNDIDWNDVIKREARGNNDEDFGKVTGVQGNYVLVQKGIFKRFFTFLKIKQKVMMEMY